MADKPHLLLTESWGHRCRILTAEARSSATILGPQIDDPRFIEMQTRDAASELGHRLMEQASFREFAQPEAHPQHGTITRRWEVVVVIPGAGGKNTFLDQRDTAIKLGRQEAAASLRLRADFLEGTQLGGCLHVIVAELREMAGKIEKGEV